MKPFSQCADRARARQGVALVIVLAFLVLLSTLIIAFLSSIQTESVSSATYGASVGAKQLVESALHVAMGQINDGAKDTKTIGSTDTADRVAWASQPGMIRTWDANGDGWKIFKLYSAKDMVVDMAGGYKTSDALATEVPSDWPNQIALYTDINSPVLIRDDTPGGITRNGILYRAEYPIVDPGALRDQVEGFNITTPPGYGGPMGTDPKTNQPQPSVAANYDPTVPPGAGKTGNPAPMPLTWMYVLRDGTLTVPSGTQNGGHTAVWSGVPAQYAPSAVNPIVGRFAFWTDDESCKLNLNTSSEPTPWDTPRALNRGDLNYGNYQPAQKEYQRFPGHPFMTALSPVFFPNQVLNTGQLAAIYSLIPRVQYGGSAGGTVNVVSASPINPDGDRLFANVDEFLFQPNRSQNAITDPQRLKRARFFLTASSRAPEVNLFGGPRISLWPIDTNPGKRTTFDRLAAFCTTIGSGTGQRPFYFQRTDPRSPTTDYSGIARNKDLYPYLQTLTSQKIPGFGGDFKTQWGDDRDQVLTEIFDYIRCVNLTDPLLPDAYEYTYSPTIRAQRAGRAANGQVTPITIGTTRGFGRFHTISQFAFHFICSQQEGQGVLTAVKPTDKLNAGEHLIEAAFLFEPFSPSLGFFKLAEDMTYEVNFKGKWTIDGQDLRFPASTIKQMNNVIDYGYHNDGRARGGAGGIRGPVQGLGGKDYPWVSTPTWTGSAVVDPSLRVIAGKGGKTTMAFSGGNVEVKVYAGPAADPTKLVQTFNLNFPGGNIPIPDLVTAATEGYRDDPPTGTPNYGDANSLTAKEYWWTFRGFTGTAGSVPGRYNNVNGVPQAPGAEYARPERRWDRSGNGNGGGAPGFKMGSMFRREDVVRAIVPKHGDIRLVAATGADVGLPGPNNGASEFVKVRDAEWESDYRFLHIFSNPSGPHFMFGFCNEPNGGISPTTNPKDIPGAADDDQLTHDAGVKYHYSRLPEIRPGAGKLYNKWGDFDNGVAQWMDGSYINKPDEGNNSTTHLSQYYFSWNDFNDTGKDIFFSPNRLVPSAGMLGSLPTGVKRNRPWQTLLFRPQKGHPGDPGYSDPVTAKSPTNKAPDHLIMDLFWMPFAEPYAISEPFSTAGKVNLNYEIAPFSYIRRATGMHGVLKAEEPLVIPNDAGKVYKLWDHETNDNGIMPDSSRDQDAQVRVDWAKAYNGQAPFDKMRLGIDPDQTLSQFDERFKAGEIFRSATQICEVHLPRKGETLSDYRNGTFWPKNLLTGDNSRERPYSNIYSRVTTKSSVFTVHIRAQVLRKSVAGGPAQWDEDRDKVVSEFRGSSVVERYLDAADPDLPDFSKVADGSATLDTNYRFRIISTKRFDP
jgi:uncharacterized protein (TIGR02600 family)